MTLRGYRFVEVKDRKKSGSPPLSLATADWRKIGTGALLAALGGLSAWFAQDVVPDLEKHGDWGILIAVAVPIVANIFRKWLLNTTGLLLLLALCLPTAASAQVQVCSPDKLAALRASLPQTTSPQWQEFFADPNTLFYTDAEMPPAYQHAPGGLIVGGRFLPPTPQAMQTTFHSPRYNISGDDREAAKGHGRGGNGNIEFPWRTPGGTDYSEGQTKTFKMMLLPRREDGRPWPIVVYGAQLGGARTGMHTGYAWMYPRGTIFGEVLALADSKGALHTFEVRLRIREKDYWNVEILRPFPRSEDLAAQLEEMGLESKALRDPLPITQRRLIDPLHPRKIGFAVQAGIDPLPRLGEELAAALLDSTPFKPSLGAVWRQEAGVTAFAPTTDEPFSIVPPKYHGTFLGTDTESCRNCHTHTLKHVDEFDANRDWYGHIRGSDEIFTFHPIDPQSIAYNGSTLPVRLRASFVSAGMVEQLDRSKHLPDMYQGLAK